MLGSPVKARGTYCSLPARELISTVSSRHAFFARQYAQIQYDEPTIDLVRRFHRVTRLHLLLKNKLGQWQISWIGNFEIEVVIENKCDLAAESFNCGNFVSH